MPDQNHRCPPSPLCSLFLFLLIAATTLRSEAQSNLPPSVVSLANAPPVITFWYGPEQRFGHLGEPQRWVNVLGNISPLEIIDSAAFSLNGGDLQPLTLGSDLHRLALPGDFNVELGWDALNEGEHELEVWAFPKEGQPVRSAVKLLIERRRRWPLPYWVNFSRVRHLQDVVQIVDGHWQLEPDGVRTVQHYYDRVLSIGDTSWRNYETTVRLTIHDYTPSEPGPPTYNVTHFGVAMRWRGHHQDGRQPSRKWFPLGAQGEFLIKDQPDSCRWRILFDGGRDKPQRYAMGSNTLTLGAPILIKTQVATLADGRTRYRFKQWADGVSEPLDWDVEGLESDDYPSGALCLVPHNSNVTIHEVRVEPLVAPLADLAARPGPGAIHFSAPVGGLYGARGTAFHYDFMRPGDQLTALRVNLANAPARLVQGLAFRVRRADGSAEELEIGPAGGEWQEWFQVPTGSRLSGISGAGGWYLDAIQFHFTNGMHSPRYGGAGGDTTFQLELKNQEQDSRSYIRGLHGTTTDFGIETIGLIFDPAE